MISRAVISSRTNPAKSGAVLVLRGRLSLASGFGIGAASAVVFGVITSQGFRLTAWGSPGTAPRHEVLAHHGISRSC
jgi:hypothetical protein